MYTLMKVDMENTAPDDLWQRIPWEDYGFDAHIRHTNAAHIREAIRTGKPDAVFLDIDGVDDMAALIGEITQGPIPCPCIVISRETDHSHIRKAMRAGAFDYCLKPVTRESLIEIACALKEGLKERIPASVQDERLAGILGYIKAHLHEKLTLAILADAFYMNRNYLCAYFKKHLEISFVEYVTAERIKKAKALLASAMTLDEIAEKTGFSDTPYFIKVFKKYEGIAPGAYRRSLTGD